MPQCDKFDKFLISESYAFRSPKDPFYDNEAEEKDIKAEEDAK
jgi:hypothetical protein